ncbi:MAG: PAS domain S-box protein, partial [Candidatus Hydrogenedentota bacterium]
IAIGICVTQADDRVTRYNRRLLEIVEYEGELTGRPIDELIAFLESNMEGKAPSLRRWFEERRPDPIRVTLPGIRNKTLDLMVNRLANNKGEPVGNLFLFHDASERKRLEEALRESEERYRLNFENVNDIIYSLSCELCYTTISPSVEALLGYGPEEFIGRRFGEENVLAREDRERAVSDAMRVLAGERIAQAEYGFIAKDGTKKFVEVSATPEIDDGEVVALIAVGRNITEHKQAEEALRESEERYRMVVEEAKDIICTVDLQTGIISSANSFGAKVLGYKPEDVLNKLTFFELVHPEDHEKVLSRLTELTFEKKREPNFPLRLRKADGTYISVEVNGAVTYDTKGNPETFIGVIRDVTEHKWAEEALRESEERYRTLVENANDVIYMLDLDGNFTFLNKVAEKITGYRIEEWLGKNFRDLVVPDDEEKILSHARKAYKGEPQRYESRIFHKNGKILTLWNFLGPIMTHDKVTGFSCIARDITETKELEQQLKESEKKYRNLVEESGNIVCVIQDGHLKFLNKVGLERSGYTKEELYSDDFDLLRLIHPDDHQVVAETLAMLSQEHFVSQRIEVRAVSKQGNIFDFILTGTSLTYQGKPAVMGVLVDITEKKRLQEQLVQSEKLASIGQLVSGVAHELNNPLSAIMGYSQLLSETKELPQKERDNAQKIFESSERCKRIIQNLLSFARKQELRRAEVNINDVLEKTIELREYDLRSRNIEVHRNYQANLKTTVGDSQQLQSVFLNLINNACDAMCAESRKGILKINTRTQGENIIVEFLDDGPGIPPESRDKVFDPFFTTKDVRKGTGLGLSISYGIVEEHGGKLFLDKSYDGGAKFVVRLPVIPTVREKELPYNAAPSQSRRAPKPRILVVDDEPTILDLSREILGGEGYDTETADTGAAAKELINSNFYDLIIADIRMPGMLSGIDLYYWAKRTNPGMENRIVFMTGDTVADETQNFLTKTKRPCLAKPFEISEYLKVIRESLNLQPENAA